MNLNDYQIVANSTAQCPPELPVIYPAIGLSGEVGELNDNLKKRLRNGETPQAIQDSRDPKMLLELGDCLWYVSRFAFDLGFTLEEVAQANVAKLRERQAKGTIRNREELRLAVE